MMTDTRISVGWVPIVIFIFSLFSSMPSNANGQDVVQQEVTRLMTEELTQEEIVDRISSLGLSRSDLRSRLQDAGYDNMLPTMEAYFDRAEGAINPRTVTDNQSSQFVSALSEMGLISSIEDLDYESTLDSLQLDNLALDSMAMDLELPVFGSSIFENITTEFQPLNIGPVDPDYLLGPGDQIQLFLTGEIELAYNLDVTREGFIVIPDVGQISVNGLTLSSLGETLYPRLSSVYSGVRRGPEATTRFHVSLGRLRTNQIFVIGEVTRPGAYQMSPAATVFNALYSANGPGGEGSMRSIQVRRSGELTGELDVYDYLLMGDASGDFRLEQGDFIFVPLAGPQVSIEGDVKRPAIYEIKTGEGLLDLIEFSGGLTASAFSEKIQVDRILSPDQRTPGRDRVLVDVDLGNLTPSEPFPLMDGDRIFVESVQNERVGRVSSEGQVQRPGDYQLLPGMTVEDLISRSGGLRRDAFENIAHLVRLEVSDSSYVLTQVALDAEGRANPNMLLQDFDEIIVYANSALKTKGLVYLGGEVKNSSSYEFYLGMTVEDLVLLGGGFSPNADLSFVEVVRRIDGEQDQVIISEVLDVYFEIGRIPLGSITGQFASAEGSRFSASDLILQPEDRVFVRRLENRRVSQDILVAGEVARPGAYSIIMKTDRIIDLIERAGGLTREADIAGVQITRDGLTLGLDLETALQNPGGPDNLGILSGDSIFVPPYNPVVTIQGAVEFESRARWVSGLNMGDYLDQAGGVREDGDRSRSVVTYSNNERKRSSKFLFINSDPEIRPGSIITVPQKMEATEGFNVDQWLTRVMSMATVLVAVASMTP